MFFIIILSILCRCIVIGETENSKYYLKFSMTPIVDHPEIVSRVRKMSDCTDKQLESIHNKCSSLMHDIIHLTHEYEYGLRNDDENGFGLSKCERAQIACFSHPKWKELASCACLICNHIWPYDEEMHQHFLAYFKDHNCKGNIPKIMADMEFCDFMNDTQRETPPDSCPQNQTDLKESDIIDDINESSSNNLFYTSNMVIIVWTVIIAVTMSLSLYCYYN